MSEVRLIDANALKKAFNKWWGCDDIPATVVEDTIDNAPTVEERPQGEWNYIQADMCVCPFCGAMPHKLYKNYCAKCGADMRKGGAEC